MTAVTTPFLTTKTIRVSKSSHRATRRGQIRNISEPRHKVECSVALVDLINIPSDDLLSGFLKVTNTEMTSLPSGMAAELTNKDTRHCVLPVNEAEDALLCWISQGIFPCSWYDSGGSEMILEALDPVDGGMELQDINICRKVWWVSIKRLQLKVAEFAELDIPEPKDYTEDDIACMREEMEHIFVKPRFRSNLQALIAEAEGRELTEKEWAGISRMLTDSGKAKIQEILTTQP
jgi:hypothetical protein